MEVLRDSRLVDSERSQTDFYDDKYWYFKILWSPAFDGRLYQEELTDYEYAAWVMDHIFNLTYQMDFIAPFSANPSTLAVELTNSKTLADRNTLYEMNVLKYISDVVGRYKNRTANEPLFLPCYEERRTFPTCMDFPEQPKCYAKCDENPQHKTAD